MDGRTNKQKFELLGRTLQEAGATRKLAAGFHLQHLCCLEA